MKKLLFSILLMLSQKGFCQCPFPATLHGSGNCTGDTLYITTANESVSKITWYNGANIVKTITANQNEAGVTVAGDNGFGTAANQFISPQSVYLDTSGNVYVADAGNGRVLKFPPGSTSLTNGITVAGGNGFGSGANQLSSPIGIFVDVTGNIFVADDLNERIQKWAPGAVSGVTVAGGNGPGTAANQFHNPYDVFVDRTGNIYVADWLNERVQKFPPGSTTATNGVTVAGGNGAGSAANQLNGPTNVFVDDSGNVYVTDRTNQRIQKWAPGATSGITVAGGNGIGSAANQLDAPFGIYVDPGGSLYVADFSNSRIQKFPPGSAGATNGITVAGGNGFGNAANQFNGPASVFVDPNGFMYVVDFQNERIQKWNNEKIDTNYIATTAGSYTAIVTDSSGCSITTNPFLISPSIAPAITITDAWNTLCSGNGSFTANISNGGTAPHLQWQVNGINVGTDSVAFNAMNLANADAVRCILTSNAACSTNFADTSNTILIVAAPVVTLKSPAGNCVGDNLVLTTKDSLATIIWYNGSNAVDTIFASNVPSTGITVAGGNGTGTAPNQFNQPDDVFFDASGNMYVTDVVNARVQKFLPGSTSGITVAGGNGPGLNPSQLNQPEGVSVDADGNVYVADKGNDRIEKWAPGATSGVCVAGGNQTGSGANELNSPCGLFIDNAGYIYVTDWGNNRVQKFPPGSDNTTSGITVAGGNGAGFAANQLNQPAKLYVDADDNLYIVDAGNNRVQKWASGSASGITVAGGNGPGFADNQLFVPRGIYVDKDGNIYVDDSGNNRIQKWAPGASSGVTVAGGNGEGAAANQFHYAAGIYVDANGNIYVAEAGNQRVQKWGPQHANDSIYIATSPGSYTAVVTNSSGCSATSNPVIINPIVTPQISITASDTAVCTGSVITLKAAVVNGGSNPKYQWLVNGVNVAGANDSTFSSDTLQNRSVVRCILNSNAQCTTISSDTSNKIVITVSSVATPAITITASRTSICPGTLVTFDATVVDAGSHPLYQWQVNGSNAGTNNPAFTNNTIRNGDVISCVMSSNAVCATVSTVKSNPVTMNVAPSITSGVTLLASANNICFGTPVTFSAIPTNGGNVPSFQWMVNGIHSGNNSRDFTSSTLNNGDVIYCIMNSSLACTSADTTPAVEMTVYPLPGITFNPDTVYATDNGGIRLNPLLSGAITQYEWSPSFYLDNTTLANPVANPPNEVNYQLQVTTENGCTAIGKVTVIAGRALKIPNAFTPNGDGRDDIFRIPPGVQFNLQELAIFDGWGNKIFTSNDRNSGWDGTYHGEPATAGVYVYLITGKTLAGTPLFLKGTVLLIR